MNEDGEQCINDMYGIANGIDLKNDNEDYYDVLFKWQTNYVDRYLRNHYENEKIMRSFYVP